jgi:hypothetical protein
MISFDLNKFAVEHRYSGQMVSIAVTYASYFTYSPIILIKTLCLLSGISSTVTQLLEMAESFKEPANVSIFAVTVTAKRVSGVDIGGGMIQPQPATLKYSDIFNKLMSGYFFVNCNSIFSK